jgi:SAM-dependent methyltransferase
LENINRLLAKQGYLNTKGFFTRATGETHIRSEAEKVWSTLAQRDPIHAAAAATTKDWYAKYPQIIDQEIHDEEKIALDAGCGYGRVAIPLLKSRKQLKLIGVDASTVMLQTFLDLLETESISELKQRAHFAAFNDYSITIPRRNF